MSRYQIVDFPTTVYRDPDIPLADGAPPLVTPDDAPVPAPAPLPARRVLRRLWLLVFGAIQLAALLTLWLDPLPADYPQTWQAIPIGFGAYFVLLGITVMIWRVTR